MTNLNVYKNGNRNKLNMSIDFSDDLSRMDLHLDGGLAEKPIIDLLEKINSKVDKLLETINEELSANKKNDDYSACLKVYSEETRVNNETSSCPYIWARDKTKRCIII